jgi:polygalacturonase
MNPIVKTNKINKMTNNGIMLLLIILIIGIVTTSPLWSSNQLSISNYNVRQFNATGDGKTYDTKSIQNAIDSCHEGGGGVVYFPPGKYLVGTLFLKSNVTLYLEANATILGSQNMEDFDIPYLIYAKDTQNTGITGRGTIDGQGEIYWKGKNRPFNRPDVMILFENCSKVVLEGVMIQNAPHWTVAISGSEYVNINGITMINDYEAPNTDGIDIMASSNVFINNCFIQGGDDCICLKNKSKEKPTENITVTNCVIMSQDAAIKLGTESVGDIKHCLFSNIVIRNTQDGIALYMKDGGTYENIHFSNITIESDDIINSVQRGSGFPIFIDIDKRSDTSKIGSMRNIVFSNISIDTGIDNCLIQGIPDQPIEGLTFDNFRMRIHSSVDHSTRKKSGGNRNVTSSQTDYANIPAHFTFANIDGLTLRNINITDETKDLSRERHAIFLVNTENITIKGLSGRQKIQDGELATIYLKDSKDALIQGCQAIPGNGSFLLLEGEEVENINVIGNDLSRANSTFKFENDILKKAFYQTANRLP